MPDEEKSEGFKVTDKRMFTAEGEVRKEDEERQVEPPIEMPPPKIEAEPADKEIPHEHFQMTFETLVMSLSSTAMVQLGVIPDPTTHQPAQHLPGAKQTIDILEILQQKTKGNLDASESKLLENILYELRMIYLEISQSIKVPK